MESTTLKVKLLTPIEHEEIAVGRNTDTICVGEKKLMRAVLGAAVNQICEECLRLDKRPRKGVESFATLKVWFDSPNMAWPFSFRRICEALGLDPDYIRKGVMNQVKKTQREYKARGEVPCEYQGWGRTKPVVRRLHSRASRAKSP